MKYIDLPKPSSDTEALINQLQELQAEIYRVSCASWELVPASLVNGTAAEIRRTLYPDEQTAFDKLSVEIRRLKVLDAKKKVV